MQLTVSQRLADKLIKIKLKMNNQKGYTVHWNEVVAYLLEEKSTNLSLLRDNQRLKQEIKDMNSNRDRLLELAITNRGSPPMMAVQQNAPNITLSGPPPPPQFLQQSTVISTAPKLPPKTIVVEVSADTKKDFIKEMNQLCALGDGESLKPSAVLKAGEKK